MYMGHLKHLPGPPSPAPRIEGQEKPITQFGLLCVAHCFSNLVPTTQLAGLQPGRLAASPLLAQ